jgi:hypothetical protein
MQTRTLDVPIEHVTIPDGALAGVQVLRAARVQIVGAGEALGSSQKILPDKAGEIGRAFEVLENGSVLLIGGGAVWSPGVSKPLVRPGVDHSISGLARDPSGGLALVGGEWLGLRKDGVFDPLVELPAQGYEVACGDDGVIYLYHPQRKPGAVFILKDLRYDKLLQVEQPVRTVAVSGRRLFLGIGDTVYSLAPGDAPSILFTMPGLRIDSLTYDAVSGVLYASDGGSVIAIVKGVGIPLMKGYGGVLRFYRRKGEPVLHVLDPKRRLLVRVTGLGWLGYPPE